MDDLNFNLLTTSLIFASLQGFLLAAFLLTTKKYHKKSNVALAFGLISTALIVLLNCFNIIGLHKVYPGLAYLPIQYTFLLAASIYYFVIFLIHPKYTFRKHDYLICFPVIIQIIFQISWLIAYFVNPELITQQKEFYRTLREIGEGTSIVFAGILFIIAIKKVITYQKQLFANYTSIENRDLTWLRNFILIIIILWIGWAIYFVGHISNSFSFEMYPVWIGMTITVYWLGYFMYLRRDVFEIIAFDSPTIPIQQNKLSEKTNDHFAKIIELMELNHLYKDPDFNMSVLSEKTELSNGYLSQIINQKTGKNFFDFVNEYRVNEVKSKLADSSFAHYSLLGIGLESGFKSKSTFNSVFKKFTGQTPSQFKKGLSS